MDAKKEMPFMNVSSACCDILGWRRAMVLFMANFQKTDV